MFKSIGNWFHSLFDKVGALISKMWTLAKPFLKEVLSDAAYQVWESFQDLFVEAAQYVAVQGLPTKEDKQKAFKVFMESRIKEELSVLKDREFNLLLEAAVSIAEKIKK